MLMVFTLTWQGYRKRWTLLFADLFHSLFSLDNKLNVALISDNLFQIHDYYYDVYVQPTPNSPPFWKYNSWVLVPTSIHRYKLLISRERSIDYYLTLFMIFFHFQWSRFNANLILMHLQGLKVLKILLLKWTIYVMLQKEWK